MDLIEISEAKAVLTHLPPGEVILRLYFSLSFDWYI
jgi:hypothetical protein